MNAVSKEDVQAFKEKMQVYEAYTDRDAFERIESALEREFKSWCENFPQLREPAPPAPISKPRFGEIKTASIWQDMVTRWESGEYRLPVSSRDGLVGPVRAVGKCLDPILPDAMRCWFDAGKPARCGDIVLLWMHPAAMQSMLERCAHDETWSATYGQAIEKPCPIIKRLFAWGRDYYMVTNTAVLPIGKNQILGVLRHTEQAQ